MAHCLRRALPGGSPIGRPRCFGSSGCPRCCRWHSPVRPWRIGALHCPAVSEAVCVCLNSVGFDWAHQLVSRFIANKIFNYKTHIKYISKCHFHFVACIPIAKTSYVPCLREHMFRAFDVSKQSFSYYCFFFHMFVTYLWYVLVQLPVARIPGIA